jgi:hypothetical protein
MMERSRFVYCDRCHALFGIWESNGCCLTRSLGGGGNVG